MNQHGHCDISSCHIPFVDTLSSDPGLQGLVCVVTALIILSCVMLWLIFGHTIRSLVRISKRRLFGGAVITLDTSSLLAFRANSSRRHTFYNFCDNQGLS